MAFTEDLNAFLRDLDQVPVVFGEISGFGFLDAPGIDADFGGPVVRATDYKITIKTADFPGLTERSALSVNGANYTVRDIHPIQDGAFSEARLKRAS